MSPNDTRPVVKGPPDLNDMFVAGLPLANALALLDEMKAYPEVSADFWWAWLLSGCPSEPAH